ncbi:MAG TPA: GntR family transcriptional regulator [Stellaceae bacterium]|nr:GntR family transcriptional regulator [Stellaceae bacterium]
MPPGSIGKLAPVRQQAAPLRNKIITALRSAVELGVLTPGTRLVEKDLCEQLGVSRTSLREALRELQAEGILANASSRGLTVGTISHEDAANAYRIRAVLEALVVEQFIEKASEAQIKALTREAETLKAAYRSGSIERMVTAKRAFYDRICQGAENPIAFDIISRLVLRTSALRPQSMLRQARQQQSVTEIEQLVDAVQRHDVAAARAAAAAHVEHAAQSALGEIIVIAGGGIEGGAAVAGE